MTLHRLLEFAPHTHRFQRDAASPLEAALVLVDEGSMMDLFLFAAGQMGAHAERSVVIEDSVPGITGALAAGMTVLGFHGGSHCRPGYDETLRAAGAVMTFDDMRQLPGLIGEIKATRNSDPST